jgi:hypothetical protein
MAPATTSRTQSLAGMERALRQVKARLGELGLTFSVWDGDGRAVKRPEPACDLCRMLCRHGAPCAQATAKLVRQAIASERPERKRLPSGCCVLAAPIRQRRRFLGVAAACYPTTDLLDDELLARRCNALQLDGQVMARAAEQACRHHADDVDDFLRMLQWCLEGEQALCVARSELDTLSSNLSTTYEELSLLYSISGSMKVTQQPKMFFQQVCEELLEVMNISSAVALVYAHPPAVQEDLALVAGEIELSDDQLKTFAATQMAPRLAGNACPLVDNAFAWRSRPDLAPAVRNLIAVPLVSEQPLGMLLALNKRAGDFDSIDIKLMSSIGNQSAVFLANNMLYADLQDLLMGVLHALTATIDAKDPYTCGHSRLVAMISKRLAEECDLPPAKVQQIYLAGLLHDIGKIGVPESTLCKPGRLTKEEYEVIKRHPGIGARILGGIRQLDDVIVGILCHHERLDGRGYPQGLKGDEVPLEARIIGMADCFDAMTSDRIYRKALPLSAVIAEIRQHAGTQFDPMAAERLLALDLEAWLEELRQPAKTVFPVTVTQESAQ